MAKTAAKKPGPVFKLQFSVSKIPYWASRFKYGASLEFESMANDIKKQKFLTKAQLVAACEWKTPRSRKHVAMNADPFVREVTSFALSAMEEQSRIESLMLLQGVSWPTASVILHFCHQDPYPVLDYRAVESFGIIGTVTYDFPFWSTYVDACRKIAGKTGYDMRTIDKALWQYSKEML